MLLHKRAGTVVAATGLLLIAVLTLTPDFTAGTQKPSLCIICGARGGEDAFLNILLFIPFGFGLRLRGMDRGRAWMVAIATTAIIETLQIWIPGRDSTLGDVMMNSIGGLSGILLCDSSRLYIIPNARQAKWLVLCGSIVWLLLAAFGAWAMRPWIPRGPYIAQVAPDLKDIELFSGRVVDARINGKAVVPNASLPASDAIRDSILSGTLTLLARVIPAGTTYGLAPIVSIASPEEPQVVVLGQDYRDIVFRVRLNGGELRMNIAEVAAQRIFPADTKSPAATTADTLDLRGDIIRGQQLVVSGASGATRSTAALSLSPFFLWSLTTPGERRSSRAFQVESMIWVAALLTPLGYWAGRWNTQSGAHDKSWFARRLPEIVLAIAIVVGLAVVPVIFEFPVASISLWITAAVAAGAADIFSARWRWTGASSNRSERVECA